LACRERLAELKLNEQLRAFGVAPMVRKVCRDNKMDLDQIYKLFRSGPGKGACKVAGLAKPTGCV
ncbi:MAG: TusE/DsrC/DsvC family sulfur relay protein, partial [Pseudomonadota bacterium]|nr:TusE/DsrC/DsvC family sulfur relay protein [Pseudomonadota bacterium]